MTMKFKNIDDMDMNGKKVIMRADFNVPIINGKITDDTRIEKSLPTIKKILEKGAKQLIIMSHLGRPMGKVVNEFRLDSVGKRLSELLNENVNKLDDCVDVEIPNDRIVLLENLRFHSDEKDNYEFFAKKLASCADIYVNDAFGTCHRAHASISKITDFLPSCAGLLVERELEIIGKAISSPNRPFVAIIGGSKISGKIGVINHLLQKVDTLLLGGAMIFTFYKAQNFEIGNSLFEEDKIDLAKLIMHNEKLVLPKDIIISNDRDQNDKIESVNFDQIPKNMIGLDIGKTSIDQFKEILKDAKTIIWNGPLGYYENDNFVKATNEIAKFISELKATTIIGGGDCVAAIEKLGLENKMTHISTGGGATLELLEGKELPGIRALQDNMVSFS
jgi:phosphoglycerate kinase